MRRFPYSIIPVSTGDQTSPDATFRSYPTDVFRVAVVANWQGKPNLKALDRTAVKIHGPIPTKATTNN